MRGEARLRGQVSFQSQASSGRREERRQRRVVRLGDGLPDTVMPPVVTTLDSRYQGQQSAIHPGPQDGQRLGIGQIEEVRWQDVSQVGQIHRLAQHGVHGQVVVSSRPSGLGAVVSMEKSVDGGAIGLPGQRIRLDSPLQGNVGGCVPQAERQRGGAVGRRAEAGLLLEASHIVDIVVVQTAVQKCTPPLAAHQVCYLLPVQPAHTPRGRFGQSRPHSLQQDDGARFMVLAQPFEHQWLGKMGEWAVAKVMSQRRQLEGAVPRAGDAGQMIDAGGMVEPGREGVSKEQLAGDTGE